MLREAAKPSGAQVSFQTVYAPMNAELYKFSSMRADGMRRDAECRRFQRKNALPAKRMIKLRAGERSVLSIIRMLMDW